MGKQLDHLEEVVIRFAGDSGDGMQLSGTQMAVTSCVYGNDVNTFPDYPSEIRAPEGTIYGVSAYQMKLGTERINTPGDEVDVLVAMNASSLKVSLANVRKNGIVIINTAGFGKKHLKLAGYEKNPLEDSSLDGYQVFAYDISDMVKKELADTDLSKKTIEKTKNIFALGLTYWLFSRSLEPTIKWLEKKFSKKPEIRDANIRVLKAGYHFGDITEDFAVQYQIEKSNIEKGTWRNVRGNTAVALGLVAAARKANLPLFLGSYPITPATEILHDIAGFKQWRVKHLQAEDEIAGITSAIGAAFGGSLAATSTSGPGLALKMEAIGLATMLELPLVIVDVMRAGPSTGLPTKPEQSDLLSAVYGPHGECPVPVIAASTASDCFDMAFEASRIAIEYMTPVILLTDGYLGQGSEPWRVPTEEELPKIDAKFATDPENFQPYSRDPETLARPWAIPGTQGLEHRIGGLEKANITGHVSHDPENHEFMCKLRKRKIEGIIKEVPPIDVHGEPEGDLLIVSWGSGYGAIETAFQQLRKEGYSLSYIHLKYLNPLPKNLGEIMKKFKRVVVPELNLGQLTKILKTKYMLPVIGIYKVQGQVFQVHGMKKRILDVLHQGVDNENISR